MSNSHLFMKSMYLRTPLKNGIGRYVCQLQRITFKFCKSSGSSRGLRDFIEQHVVDFATNNPGIMVYLKPRRHRAPKLVAEYLNGETVGLPLQQFTSDQILKWLQVYTTSAGYEDIRVIKNWQTQTPSIQGVWTPYTFRDPRLNVEDIFDQKFSTPKNLPPTATELLKEMFRKQQEGKLSENVVIDEEQVLDSEELQLQKTKQ